MANALIIKDLIEALNENINSFERKIHVSNGRIRKAIGDNSQIKDDVIEKILSAFPQVNKDWLYTGMGAMFTEPEKPVPIGGLETIHIPPDIEDQIQAIRTALGGKQEALPVDTIILAKLLMMERDIARIKVVLKDKL